MPLVNIYTRGEAPSELTKLVPELRIYLAKKLSGEGITLAPSEISVRFLRVQAGEMIGDLEVEIAAHAFEERVKEQDEICLQTMTFLEEKSGIKNIKVWLRLSELGHSW